nr:uncharacterized serine-rich protein C215.13-like [Ipomoea batatas]GME10234.1 uncharacterized serine-rich protein C215.13-like [Ipomoea batatas]
MICSREKEESNSELFQVNNVQEEEDERLDSGGAIQQLSMLHLISAAKHQRPTTKTPEKCTSCGGSMKRPSPSFPSSLQEPSPKRLSLLPPSPPSLLYRSLSEPIDSLGLLNPQTADNSKISPPPPILSDPSPVNNSESRNRPPIPPLHRCLSDPTAAALEFRPQTIKSPAQESPNTKRVKRMKDRLKQMREWWDQVLQEEDEEEEEEDSYAIANAAEDNNSKEEDKGEEAKTSEESVWVEEKGGEGLVIHFKCPCNKGYEILLSGNNCYYKLM